MLPSVAKFQVLTSKLNIVLTALFTDIPEIGRVTTDIQVERQTIRVDPAVKSSSRGVIIMLGLRDRLQEPGNVSRITNKQERRGCRRRSR